MSADDLMARIEQARNSLDSARQLVSEAQEILGIRDEPPPPEPEERGFFDKAWGAIGDHAHTALDLAGFLPVVGTAADLAHAAWYAAEGDYTNAGLLALGAVPIAGDAAAAARLGNKASDAIRNADRVEDAASTAGDVARAEDYIDNSRVLSEERLQHILESDGKGGGGHGPGRGISGKSEYPSDWSDEQVIRNTLDVATDPNSRLVHRTGSEGSFYTKNGDPARFTYEGTRDGVKMRVVVEPAGEGIITSFPPDIAPNP